MRSLVVYANDIVESPPGNSKFIMIEYRTSVNVLAIEIFFVHALFICDHIRRYMTIFFCEVSKTYVFVCVCVFVIDT